ncbi:RING-H2 finger protein ATL57 [Ricinus communis]|uniref:RING-type E3 ubiquitin transferase n=1 Tax=Ricinus communis TaxID=3988 RepID=B9SCM2_RICCO|nr:RING-H2 finger protein ATL57 [Ricinus communis]EEF38681.1 zinc finger protein, putative [Ricinus communis]
MKKCGRKLQVQPPYTDVSFQPINTLHNMSSPPPQSVLKPPYPNPPFDSSMALTVLVLLSALFFMGFFSIYIRRFSTEPASEFTSHHPGPGTPSNQRPSRVVGGSRKGLDPEVIKSLPVYSYYHGEAKYQIECAVCLGEFEEKETVKSIPYCKHMFHLECIETWLKLHVTCPVCRGTQFLEVKSRDGDGGDGGGGSDKVVRIRVDDGGNSSQQDQGRSMVGDADTGIELGTLGTGRTGNCSSLGERILLSETSSL